MFNKSLYQYTRILINFQFKKNNHESGGLHTNKKF